ncbi:MULTISPECIES: stress-induced protein [unclassified Pseudomonas]|uniref:stress-induced protein n=1 Tax=unclassified Pseudomonas TaxID=196821 RepID=UPI00381C7083
MANDQGKGGQQGGMPQQNPDQVTNDPNKAWESGRQGGAAGRDDPQHNSEPGQQGGQTPEDKWGNDTQRSGGAGQQGGMGGHGSGSRSDGEREAGMEPGTEVEDEEDSGMNKDDR